MKVINPHPGDLEDVGDRFGDTDSDQEGPYEARTLGNGDRLNTLQVISGPGQCLCYNRQNDFDVPSRSKLGNNSAILAM